jgi:hypothetical protein
MPDSQERVIWHYDHYPSYSALYLKVPARNLTLFLLANSDGLSAPCPIGNAAGSHDSGNGQ